MILDNNDILKEDYFNNIIPLDKHFKEYLINYILPEAIAFYLKESYYRNCLCDSSLHNHINSTMEILCNYEENINKLIPKIKEILQIKYNLKITNMDPLQFKLNAK